MARSGPLSTAVGPSVQETPPALTLRSQPRSVLVTIPLAGHGEEGEEGKASPAGILRRPVSPRGHGAPTEERWPQAGPPRRGSGCDCIQTCLQVLSTVLCSWKEEVRKRGLGGQKEPRARPQVAPARAQPQPAHQRPHPPSGRLLKPGAPRGSWTGGQASVGLPHRPAPPSDRQEPGQRGRLQAGLPPWPSACPSTS